MKILQISFGNVNPVNIAKHDFYKLRQTNKNLEVFLNSFLRLQNKACISNKQPIDHVYKKLSNEVRVHLVIFPTKTDLSALITFLQEIDSNLKILAKSFYINKNTATSPTSVSKPLSKTLNSASAKPLTSVKVTVTARALSTSTRTHFDHIDVLTAIYKEPISQEEKKCHNRLGLCYYWSEPGHIAIYHKNPATLATKKQATGITNHLMALVLYVSLIEEKKLFLS